MDSYIMKERLLKIDNEIHYLLNELRRVQSKSDNRLKEFEKIKADVSNKVSKSFNPTLMVRDMREKRI